MKKLSALFSALFLSGFAFTQTLSNTENYIQTRTYLEPVTSSSTTAKQVHTVQYFDGLGRPKQIVNVKGSPTHKDVVVHIEYDQWGRQVKDYLPVPQSGTQNGLIYTSPLVNASSVYGQDKIYSEKILEASPLNRVLQQKQVGNAWSNHPIVFGYGANSASEVKKITTATTWANNATSSVLTISGTYGANQLYKNTVTDEDGNISIEFKNGQGHTLLVRKHDGSQNVDTYYVYNEYDQLAFVISPLAAAKTSLTSTDLDELCYQYRYDGRNRLVEKKLPGKGWEYLVYDKADRLVLTQDANLQQQGKWLFTKYDAFGRVIYTGILPGGNRISMQNQISSLVITESKDPTGFTKNGMQVYYTNGYLINIQTVLSVNYYDTYPAGAPTVSGAILMQAVLTQDSQNSSLSTKSLPTASYVKNIEDDNWTKTYNWYDTKGRPVGSYSINHLGGFTKTESELDFSGAVKKTNTYHSRASQNTQITVQENFTYDHQYRLLTHKHKVNTNPEVTLSASDYNELSQLTSKSINSGLQIVNYTYNIRGWISGINEEAYDDVEGSGKLFSYRMKYNDPQDKTNANGHFNGNISEVDWVYASGSKVQKRYNYDYDPLNRLTHAHFSNPDLSIPNNEFNDEIINYDRNGNITSLQRNAAPFYAASADQIDDLQYSYAGNRLTSIQDHSGNPSGYEGGGNSITYDVNGNMINMPDKRIDQIDYNFLNLPNKLQTDGNNKTTFYMYRADGLKLRKNFNYLHQDGLYYSATIEYLDGFHYHASNGTLPYGLYHELLYAYEQEAFINYLYEVNPDAQLKFFPTAEGFYDYENYEYIYQYKDHLGNVRVSYKNAGGTPEVVDTNDYYPFGMNFIRNEESVFGTGSFYNYKYNGKELQETGMYDYGARFYMPDIGRWGVVDGLSEGRPNMSPYRYSFNNPVNATDPTGLWEDWVGTTAENGSTTWQWRNDLKSAQQAKAAGFDSYSDGITNNTYTSISGSEVTLGPKGPSDWSQDFTNVNRARLGQAIANCSGCQQIESFEKFLFIGVPLALATGGAGGFALLGKMTAGAIGGRMLTDATVQTAVNLSTNGGNFGNALGDVNLTQSVLAGAGMNYVGNSIISSSTVVSGSRQATVFNGGIGGKEFATQSVLSVTGGAIAKGIRGSSVFKGTVVGSYMQTTTRFGQTAGSAVGTMLLSSPDYATGVATKKFP